MKLLCIFIQIVLREDIRRSYDIIIYFYLDIIQRGFRPQAVHMLVLLRVYDALEACVTQTHTVPGFLILYHRKVLLNVGCAGEDGHQTTN